MIAGFFISYNSSALQPNVTESVGRLLQKHPNANLYVIGHSMGAAMATVCVLDLKFRYNLTKEKTFLYTFGSPRIGNDIFAAFLRKQVEVGSLSVSNLIKSHRIVSKGALCVISNPEKHWRSRQLQPYE